MENIRWGIIGAGRISAEFAAALIRTQGTQLAAVASRDHDRAQEFAGRFGIARAYGSYEELVEDQEIDVVYIGTPHSKHKKNAMLCLNHGKHVLCEKAFTLNEEDTAQLIEMAGDKGLFLMEAMWTKFHPVTNKVKEWIDQGRIGAVRLMNISFGFKSEFNQEDRLFNISMGGGALLDVGIYPVTYAVHMMGEMPVSVSGSAWLGKTGVDEVNNVQMQFENGAIAVLSSAISANLGQEGVLIGEKGKIVLDRFFMAQKAEIYDNEGRLTERYEEPFLVNGYEYEIMEVNRCIQGHKTQSPVNPLEDTKNIMHLLDQIRSQWGLVYPQEK